MVFFGGFFLVSSTAPSPPPLPPKNKNNMNDLSVAREDIKEEKGEGIVRGPLRALSTELYNYIYVWLSGPSSSHREDWQRTSEKTVRL